MNAKTTRSFGRWGVTVAWPALLLGWGIVGAACSGTACPGSERDVPEAGQKRAWPTNVRPYPGARRLCAGEDTAGALRVWWATHAAKDEPSKVAAFYGGDAGEAPRVVRREAGLVVAVHDAARGDYPRCQVSPAPEERSVILVTRPVPRLPGRRTAWTCGRPR